MRNINLSHNLDDVELEEVLEKALNGLRKRSEDADSPLPDNHAEELRNESQILFNKVANNMLEEIEKVIGKE